MCLVYAAMPSLKSCFHFSQRSPSRSMLIRGLAMRIARGRRKGLHLLISYRRWNSGQTRARLPYRPAQSSNCCVDRLTAQIHNSAYSPAKHFSLGCNRIFCRRSPPYLRISFEKAPTASDKQRISTEQCWRHICLGWALCKITYVS